MSGKFVNRDPGARQGWTLKEIVSFVAAAVAIPASIIAIIAWVSPAPPVVIVGPAAPPPQAERPAPTAPVPTLPRSVAYKEQAKLFHAAFDDFDEQYLTQVYAEGFRLKSADMCDALQRIARHPRERVGRAIEELIRLEGESTSCVQGGTNPSPPMPADSWLLDTAMLFSVHFDSNNICAPDSGNYKWSTYAGAIDAWVKQRGKTEDFQRKARNFLLKLKKTTAMGRDEWVRECAVLYGAYRSRRVEYLKQRETMLFGEPCIYRQGQPSIEQLVEGVGLPTDAAAQAVCSRQIIDAAQISRTLKFKPYLEALERWSS